MVDAGGFVLKSTVGGLEISASFSTVKFGLTSWPMIIANVITLLLSLTILSLKLRYG